jgi:hypothetical protein
MNAVNLSAFGTIQANITLIEEEGAAPLLQITTDYKREVWTLREGPDGLVPDKCIRTETRLRIAGPEHFESCAR